MANVTPEYRERVREWVAIDTQIKAAAFDMKDLRKRSNDLKAWIMDYMEEHEIDRCNIMNRTQTLSVMHRESAIKPRKDEVIAKMGRFLQQHGSSASGDDLYKYIYEDNVQKRKARTLSRRKRAEPKKQRLEATIDEEDLLPEEEEDEEGLGTV